MVGSKHLLRTRIIASVALVAAAACRAQPPRLTDGATSLDDLTARYVTAVLAGDTAGMHRLRVTAHEHNAVMWPEFPASRRNFPVDVAWHNIDTRSIREAVHIREQYAGDSFDVVGTTCRDGVTAYDTFRVHGDCWVTLRRGSRPSDVKLFGSVVEMDGRFKVIGIRTD